MAGVNMCGCATKKREISRTFLPINLHFWVYSLSTYLVHLMTILPPFCADVIYGRPYVLSQELWCNGFGQQGATCNRRSMIPLFFAEIVHIISFFRWLRGLQLRASLHRAWCIYKWGEDEKMFPFPRLSGRSNQGRLCEDSESTTQHIRERILSDEPALYRLR